MPRRNTAQTRRRVRRATERARAVDTITAAVEAAPIDPRRTLIESLVASGDASRQLTTGYDVTYGSLSGRFFVDAALEAGFTDVDHSWWPCEQESLAPDGRAVFRDSDHEHVLRLDDGTVALLSIGGGALSVKTAGPSAATAISEFAAAYPAAYLTAEADGRVPITFWMMGSMGPVQRLRKIDAQPWKDVERNYNAEVRGELERVMAWESGDDANGQLLLWQGLPGTGKTWALRALASQWADWAEFHYITDPDVFFGQRSSYMIDVLLSDSYMALEQSSGDVFDESEPGGKWKILILEDTGDLLASNARDSYSAGLSRLLNVVDGMIGQGLRVLALVTTNDQLDDFHPAVTRPGRCASQMSFGPLDPDEAEEWLTTSGAERTSGPNGEMEAIDAPMTLAELYARAHAGTEAFSAAMEDCAACDHAFSAHLGDSGPCTTTDCMCGSYEEPASESSAEPAALEASAAEEYVPDGEVDHALLVLTAGGRDSAEYARVRLSEFLLLDAPAANPDAGATATSPVAVTPTGGARWTAILCPEGVPTEDGRIFAPGATSWRDLPLTLMGMIETAQGHDGAQVCGRIDRIWKEGNLTMGEGVFDSGEFGADVARMVGDGTLRGVSVDIAIREMELAYRSDILGPDGEWIGGSAPGQAAADADAGEGPDIVDAIFGEDDDEVLFVVWDGVIGAATVCPFPAFAEASIETPAMTASGRANPMMWRLTHQGRFSVTAQALEHEIGDDSLVASVALAEPELGDPLLATAADDMSLSAAGGPVAPPAGWFSDPELDALTPLTVDEDGRVYGHAAEWGTCHLAFPDSCTTAPESQTMYSYFHLKEVETEDGELVSVGTITLDTGHAGARLGRVETARHYDHTGTAVADVVCGEDDHGIWFSGAVRSGMTDEQMRKLRGSVLSGDWRNVNGHLELVALLAVNVPGFPVPRHPRPLVAGGQLVSLVAAGIRRAGDVSRGEANALDALRDEADGLYDEIADAVA